MTCSWNQWVYLPLSYTDLPRDAQLCITLYDCAGPGRQIPVGATTISLFGKHGVYRQGMLDLRVWPGVEADGGVPTSTPGKARDDGKEQMQRLAKLVKKHRNGQINKIDWLDRLTFREIELINEKEKRASEYLYLMIEFPEVTMDGVPVYNEHFKIIFMQNIELFHIFILFYCSIRLCIMRRMVTKFFNIDYNQML